MIDPLLVNARIAIQLGVEDYQALDARRALSAVRNIAAGVLLVFKEKLRAMSPDGTDEVLLKERVNPVHRHFPKYPEAGKYHPAHQMS